MKGVARKLREEFFLWTSIKMEGQDVKNVSKYMPEMCDDDDDGDDDDDDDDDNNNNNFIYSKCQWI